MSYLLTGLFFTLPFPSSREVGGGGGVGISFFSPQEALGEICVLAWEFKAMLFAAEKLLTRAG